MQKPSRKVILAVVVVSGVALTVAAGLALRRPLLERWYLWQVESGQGEAKDAALARLEEMGSVRAIPFVLELTLGARVSESTSGAFFAAVYDGSDLLEDFSTPLKFAVGETFVDLIWEIVPTEGHRPSSGPSPSVPVFQTAAGHQAIRTVLSVWRRVRALVRPAGLKAIPVLNETLRDQEAERLVKLIADLELRALIERLKNRRDVSYLVGLLARRELLPEVGGYVIVALGELGTEARSALPALVAALQDEDSRNRMHAADALRKIGSVPEEGIDALRELSKNDEAHYVRHAAAQALSKLGPKHTRSGDAH